MHRPDTRISDLAIERFLERYDRTSTCPERDIRALLTEAVPSGTTPTGDALMVHPRRLDLAFVLRLDRTDPANPYQVVTTIMPTLMRPSVTSRRAEGSRRRSERQRWRQRHEHSRAW